MNHGIQGQSTSIAGRRITQMVCHKPMRDFVNNGGNDNNENEENSDHINMQMRQNKQIRNSAREPSLPILLSHLDKKTKNQYSMATLYRQYTKKNLDVQVFFYSKDLT